MGKIAAFCDYNTAMYFQDITSYYADVVRSVSVNLTDKTASKYIVLQVAENSDETKSSMRVFGTEWIDLATLEVVQETTYTDFRVYDVNGSKAADIRAAIASLGYAVDILPS